MSEAELFSEALLRSFSPVRDLSPAIARRLYEHYSTLVRWNKVLNLTSIWDLAEAVTRHYCESLFAGVHLPPESVSVLDVGSGAGFPGIPMAVLRPDCSFTLAEARQRKAVFLLEATRDLANVRVLPVRAEQINETFDWAVSRAVKFEEVLRVARRVARRAALLMSEVDAERACRASGVHSAKIMPLPWGKRQVLLLLELVPRGT